MWKELDVGVGDERSVRKHSNKNDDGRGKVFETDLRLFSSQIVPYCDPRPPPRQSQGNSGDSAFLRPIGEIFLSIA